jgi:DNA-binding transcriptional LysR family regulator
LPRRNGWPVSLAISDFHFAPIARRHRLAAARAGYGVALLPRYIVATHEPDLVEVSLGERLPERDVWLLVRRDLKDVPRVRAVTDYLVEVFQRDRRLLAG